MNDRFSNGMRFAFRRNRSEVAWCALTIRSGTRDEGGAGKGIAHFTEHLLFKGTDRKSASAINNCLESGGGDLNAFTTKEETVIHATVTRDQLRKGVGLLFELAFRSLFRESDINKEKGIIIDEIQSYKDSPPEAIYDHFEELLLAGTPLEPQILGSVRGVSKVTGDDIRRYVDRNFIPSRMALSIVADMDGDKAFAMAQKEMEKYVTRTDYPLDPQPERTAALREGALFDLTLNKRNHQANCIIGCTGYPVWAERERITLVLLCNMLGGPAASSRLNMLLREKHGWVYGVDVSYTPYSDNGVVAISFGCDKDNLGKCCDAVMKELLRLRTSAVSDRVLKAAKKQLKGQLFISSDNGENKCLAIGKSILVTGAADSDEKGIGILESVTAEELRLCAEEIFRPERLSKLTYL